MLIRLYAISELSPNKIWAPHEKLIVYWPMNAGNNWRIATTTGPAKSAIRRNRNDGVTCIVDTTHIGTSFCQRGTVIMQTPLNSPATRTVICAAAVTVGLALPSFAHAQTPAPAPATTTSSAVVSSAPKTFALVAAVGDQFQYVRQKESVGSHLEPYIRHNMHVPDNALNHAVLRGLDRALAADFPDSERVFLAMRSDFTAEGVLPQDREAETMRRVMAMLEKNPARKDWDQIIVVTPKWLMSERQGMGAKLSGIGMYVQPLGALSDVADEKMGDLVENPDRTSTTSRTFVAPFFYVQVTTLDAKTLKTLRSESRYDFRKVVNKESAALDVEYGFTPEQLASTLTRFVETSALRAVNDKVGTGTVQVGPVKTLPAAVPEKK